MFRKLLPKHSPALRPRDYAPYLLDRVRLRRSQRSLTEVWGPRLSHRILHGTPSGRHALWEFLEATNLPAGSEVLVAAYNYYVIIRLLIQKGLRPIFVDVERDTLGMDPEDLRRKISPSSRLVIVTHMFGIPADAAAVTLICAEEHLLLFEDCAHAVGTIADGRHVGGFGEGALFSFGPSKSVTCFGGGMLALAPSYVYRTRSGPQGMRGAARWRTFFNMLLTLLMAPTPYRWSLYPLAQLAQRLADRGVPALRDLVTPSKDYASYRFSPQAYPPFREFMSDVLHLQLARLDRDVNRRRAVIAAVKGAVRSNPEVGLLNEDRHGRSNGSYFGLYVPDPGAFTTHMFRSGIEVNPHEFYDCSRLAQFSDYASDCPNAAYASNHLVRLPSYSKLSARDVVRITAAANAYFAGTRWHTQRAAAVTTASSTGA